MSRVSKKTNMMQSKKVKRFTIVNQLRKTSSTSIKLVSHESNSSTISKKFVSQDTKQFAIQKKSTSQRSKSSAILSQSNTQRSNSSTSFAQSRKSLAKNMSIENSKIDDVSKEQNINTQIEQTFARRDEYRSFSNDEDLEYQHLFVIEKTNSNVSIVQINERTTLESRDANQTSNDQRSEFRNRINSFITIEQQSKLNSIDINQREVNDNHVNFVQSNRRSSVYASKTKNAFKSSRKLNKHTRLEESNNDQRTLSKSKKTFMKELNFLTHRFYLTYLVNFKQYELVQIVFFDMKSSHQMYNLTRKRVSKSYKKWKTNVWNAIVKMFARWINTTKANVSQTRASLHTYKAIRIELLRDYNIEWSKTLLRFALFAIDFNDIELNDMSWIKCKITCALKSFAICVYMSQIHAFKFLLYRDFEIYISKTHMIRDLQSILVNIV